jgi:hypothetical protein
LFFVIFAEITDRQKNGVFSHHLQKHSQSAV